MYKKQQRDEVWKAAASLVPDTGWDVGDATLSVPSLSDSLPGHSAVSSLCHLAAHSQRRGLPEAIRNSE